MNDLSLKKTGNDNISNDKPLTPAPKRSALGEEMMAAAQALLWLREGQALPDALLEARAIVAKSSWPAVKDMAYQAVRQMGLCEALAEILNNKAPPPEVLALQMVALTQLMEERRAAAIIIDQVVEACKADSTLRFSAGFMNAVLRRFLREKEALLAKARLKETAQYNLPAWWLSLLRRDHPLQWQNIVANSHGKAPMSLRVNLRQTTVEAYRRLLDTAGLAYQPSEIIAKENSPTAAGLPPAPQQAPCITLSQAVEVHHLPGWEQGMVSVQDLGAQLAAPLLDASPGMRVLDACAAPGGKAAHLLEMLDCQVFALEIDAERAQRIAENFDRGGFSAWPKAKAPRILIGDASQPKDWWDGQLYDRILVDAPCSASGIVARHPDIPWLRRRSDIATLSATQGKILLALWPLLQPGGKLLLCTCSVFRDEGEHMLAKVLTQLPGAQLEPLTWQFGASAPVKLGHLLPTRQAQREHDGFFFARLVKSNPM